MHNRREMLGKSLVAGLGVGIAARSSANLPLNTLATLPLWPSTASGRKNTGLVQKVDEQSSTPGIHDRWITGVGEPHLVVYPAFRPNGSAVLLVPGGGYSFLAYDNEGASQAAWLNQHGVTAFILMYRLPTEGWVSRSLVPLQDAQRAVRLIRSRASDYRFDPSRVGALGFSAGGHLAGSLATRHDEKTYERVDAADGLSARPDVVGMIYPVVSMDAKHTHVGSRDNLLGPAAGSESWRSASVERHVSDTTPPVFLAHAIDDSLVPAENSLAMHSAMVAAGRSAELHIFDEGGHGFGVRLAPELPASGWPSLFYAFGLRKGVFAP